MLGGVRVYIFRVFPGAYKKIYFVLGPRVAAIRCKISEPNDKKNSNVDISSNRKDCTVCVWQDFLCDVTSITSARTNYISRMEGALGNAAYFTYVSKLCSGIVHNLHEG